MTTKPKDKRTVVHLRINGYEGTLCGKAASTVWTTTIEHYDPTALEKYEFRWCWKCRKILTQMELEII